MTTHLTVRLAWHDNAWNGAICRDPRANVYCCGSHSLLSDRIAREKQTAIEQNHPGEPLDALLPEYLPPCHWSSSAFSAQPINIVHLHPFRNYRESHTIPDQLPPAAVYTWPFRLSLTHGKDAKKRDGKYPPDWDARADRYLERLTNRTSLVFFYLNYDNPVSADEYKYALVGCSRLVHTERTGKFSFKKKELAELCSGKGMQHFGPENWALKITHDFPAKGVRLPYQEYLEHVAKFPDEESKLDEIKVLVDEPALLPGVKYVSEQVNDDACLYLLYKLRKAFERVAEHGIASPGESVSLIDGFIEEFWRQRGLYPGLASVVGLLSALRHGDPDWENADDGGIVAAVREALNDEERLLGQVFEMLAGTDKPEMLTAAQIKILRQARRGFQQYTHLVPVIRRLSLFDLTARQLTRILFPDATGQPHPFGGRPITSADLAANPYLLCEEYVPTTIVDKERANELDREQRTDGPIDYFTIDVGLFPVEDRYDCLDDELQNLHATGKERLRAFAVTTLRQQQDKGHTYAPLRTLVEAAQLHPLFYRHQLAITAEHFLSSGHLAHFRERLHVEQVEREYFFYLQETKQAEDIVARVIKYLLDQRPHKADLSWVDTHLNNEAKVLGETIPGFSSELFHAERRRLIEGVMRQRLFLVTGRPGSGKTRALREVVTKLTKSGQKVTILAPTGKATLRVSKEAPQAEVLTIDRWLSQCRLLRYLDNLAELRTMRRSKEYRPVQNLIIDESSMVDLARLAVVLRAIEVHEPDVARVVFVGDENQLPPIGMGRPLYDVLEYLHRDPARAERHVVRLRSNCRQRQDRTVIDAAQLFAGKNRYRTDLYQRLLAGREISPHLRVEYWENPERLNQLIEERLDILLELAGDPDDEAREKALNLAFNLYENGYVKGYREREENQLRIDAMQILSPYRGGYAGSMGLNQAVRERYRAISYPSTATNSGGRLDSAFAHSDKIIRISNHYGWTKGDDGEWTKELKLSNGSIGVLCNNKYKRNATFPESPYAFNWADMQEEDFETAYAITVHKAQGSEFSDVFVVVPERRGLLSRELLYTAMTRSTGAMTLFVQRSMKDNPLDVARSRSDLLRRNSSLLTLPLDARRVFEPEPGITLKSKVEYVIYEALRKARDEGRLTFGYEDPPLELPFAEGNVLVKPDFTCAVGDRRYYWEHLGMLDCDDYYNDWQDRRKAYETKQLGDQLITTDDLHGIHGERLSQLIESIISGKFEDSPVNEFSQRHYCL